METAGGYAIAFGKNQLSLLCCIGSNKKGSLGMTFHSPGGSQPEDEADTQKMAEVQEIRH